MPRVTVAGDPRARFNLSGTEPSGLGDLVGDLGSSVLEGEGGSRDALLLGFQDCGDLNIFSGLRLVFMGSCGDGCNVSGGASFSVGAPFRRGDGVETALRSNPLMLRGGESGGILWLLEDDGLWGLLSSRPLEMAAIPWGVSHSSIRKATVPNTFAANER